MSDEQIRVVFQPLGRAVFAMRGTKMIEAAAEAGLTIDTPCGGTGLCGKCRVQIADGADEPTDNESRCLTVEQLQAGWRLACQTTVVAPAVVHVPDTSIFASQHQILTQTQSEAGRDIMPAVRKVYVELPPPTLEDPAPDLLRLERKVGPVKAGAALLNALPGLLRAEGFRGTCVLTDHHLIDFEPGDTSGRCFGVATDIGTTTVVASMLDLSDGRELAIASAINPQVRFGDDVISRIKHAESPDGLSELRGEITRCIAELVRQLCIDGGVRAANIYELAFAGNTTMLQLLSGIDVSPLGVAPFAPAFGRGLMLPAADLGLAVHARAAAYIFPVIGGFVGGDTVAGILSSRLDELDGPVLMVDVGTNGEIVLQHGGRLWAASTAAGPAFEGARISCGMRAAAGAIEKVVFDGDVHVGVIGDAAPVGICGSGLIDVAAELLRCGVVTPQGRLLTGDDLPSSLEAPLRRRCCIDDSTQPRFLLDDCTGRSSPLWITQRDIRELQLAGGAIRAGITMLLRQAGLTPHDLKLVLLAGGFGSYIRRENAQRIGLLPGHIDHQRVHYIGNASLSGARWALLSTRARNHAEDLARQTVHVELSQDAGFQAEFAEAMIFPGQE